MDNDARTFTVWPDGRVSYATQNDRNQSLVLDPDHWDTPAHLDGTVLQISPDGRRAAAISSVPGGYRLQLLDSHTLQAASSTWPLAESQGVSGVGWTPDGSTLLVTEDQKVQVRDGSNGAPRQELVGHSGFVMGVAVAGPARDIVWTAGRDGTAVAFDLSGRRGVIRTLPGTVPGAGGATARTSPVGVKGVREGEGVNAMTAAHLFDTATGRDLGSFEMTGLGPEQKCWCTVGGLAIAPDGRQAIGAVYRAPQGPGAGKTSGEVSSGTPPPGGPPTV